MVVIMTMVSMWTAFGGPATFTWAIKFDPAQLADFDGASLTKIQIYNRLASTDELRITKVPMLLPCCIPNRLQV